MGSNKDKYNFVFDVGGRKVSLTFGEALKLRDKLCELFGEGVNVNRIFVDSVHIQPNEHKHHPIPGINPVFSNSMYS